MARQTKAWKGPGGVLASLEGRITGLADSSDRFRVAGIDLAVPGRQIHPPHALRIPGGRLGESAGIAAADPRWASA